MWKMRRADVWEMDIRPHRLDVISILFFHDEYKIQWRPCDEPLFSLKREKTQWNKNKTESAPLMISPFFENHRIGQMRFLFLAFSNFSKFA